MWIWMSGATLDGIESRRKGQTMQAHMTHLTNRDQDAKATSRVAPLTRELAARDADGLHVLLLWLPHEDQVTVSVEDSRAGARFAVEVASDRALDAFYHPFAYAA
jgi:hypothetical protein